MNPKEQILSSLPEDKRKEAENILKLLDSKDLTMLEELQTMNETLKEIKNKPDVEIPPVDLTEITSLLQKLLDKESEPINITLEII